MVLFQQFLITASFAPRIGRHGLLANIERDRLGRIKEYRHGHGVDIINSSRCRLNPAFPSEGAKDLIPESCLLSVIVTLLPPRTVVKIMILNDEFAVEVLKKPRERIGGDKVDAETRMADEFAEDNVLRADPPVVESHRQAHEFEGCPC